MPIPESIINLGMSILLSFHIGPAGIFVGTTISTLCMPFMIEPYILFKKGFNKSTKIPLVLNIKYIFFTLIIVVTTYTLSSFIHLSGIIGVAVLIVIDTILVNALIVVLSKTLKIHEFDYVLDLIRKWRK